MCFMRSLYCPLHCSFFIVFNISQTCSPFKGSELKVGPEMIIICTLFMTLPSETEGCFFHHVEAQIDKQKVFCQFVVETKTTLPKQQNNCVTPNDKKPICTVFGTHIHSNKPIKKREVRLNSHPWLLYALPHPPSDPHPFAAPPRMSSADSGPALPLLLLPALPVPELRR